MFLLLSLAVWLIIESIRSCCWCTFESSCPNRCSRYHLSKGKETLSTRWRQTPEGSKQTQEESEIELLCQQRRTLWSEIGGGGDVLLWQLHSFTKKRRKEKKDQWKGTRRNMYPICLPSWERKRHVLLGLWVLLSPFGSLRSSKLQRDLQLGKWRKSSKTSPHP